MAGDVHAHEPATTANKKILCFGGFKNECDTVFLHFGCYLAGITLAVEFGHHVSEFHYFAPGNGESAFSYQHLPLPGFDRNIQPHQFANFSGPDAGCIDHPPGKDLFPFGNHLLDTAIGIQPNAAHRTMR